MVTVILVALITSSAYYLKTRNIKKVAEEVTAPFEVDQILIKVLIKSGEFISKEVRIMNTDDKAATFELIAENLQGIAGIDAQSFTLKPGQTKAVGMNFSSFDNENRITQSPGIYVGKLVVSSGRSSKEVPVIVEIESANVLFDMNLNPLARDRRIERGNDAVIEVRLFNLEGLKPVNVDMHYLIKDLNGNTIITESETVVVKTQASFFKTISIPKNLRTGDYVFIAAAEYGGSVGTASYLFEVVSKEPAKAEEKISFSLKGFCRDDVVCWSLSLLLVLIIFSIGAYVYFFVGAYIYNKVSARFTELLSERGRKPLAAVKEKQKAKGKKFFLFRLPSREERKEKKETKKLEKETLKLERIKKKQEIKKIRLIEKERKKEELEKKAAEQKERLKRLEEEKGKESKKRIFAVLHNLGLAKTEEEKKKLELERLKREEQKRRQKEIEEQRRLEQRQGFALLIRSQEHRQVLRQGF